MRPSLAFLAMVAPAVIAAGSCALKGFTVEAGSSSSGTGGDASARCGVTYPSPPAKAVAGGMVEFTVAFHSINFGDKGVVGIDLDNLCTCHGDGPSCQSAKMQCDDLGEGRDNSAASLLSALTLVLKPGNFGSDFYTSKANDGYWSLLLRVRDYNGEVNDAQVEVDWYVSTGFSMKGVGTPLWDGSDTWTISGGSVDNMSIDQPKYADKNAYVSDSMLVASLPDAEIDLSGGTSRMTIHLTGAGILAKIDKDLTQTKWLLTQGQLLGRWKLTDVFKSVGSYRDPPICTDNAFYSTAKGYICSSADILAGVGTTALPCDALSFGVGFTADPAQLGAVAPPLMLDGGCADGSDPSTDSCGP